MFYFLRKGSESYFSPNCHRPEVHQMLRMMIYKNSFFDNKRFEKWESEQEMLRMMILVREWGKEEKKSERKSLIWGERFLTLGFYVSYMSVI